MYHTPCLVFSAKQTVATATVDVIRSVTHSGVVMDFVSAGLDTRLGLPSGRHVACTAELFTEKLWIFSVV